MRAWLQQRKAEQIKEQQQQDEKRREEEMIDRVREEVRLLFYRWGTRLPKEARCDRGEKPSDRNGRREDDLGDDLEQQAWLWLLGEAGQRMIANADKAICPDAYMREAIHRRLDHYICKRYRIGRKSTKHRYAVTFDSKLLDDLVDAGADLPTHRPNTLSRVEQSELELNDRLDRAPEGVRLYLCAYANNPKINTDKAVREAYAWTRTTLEKYRQQAYDLLTEDLPDFRPAAPPRESPQPAAQPEPDAVAGADVGAAAFGDYFEEMQFSYGGFVRQHPDCSVAFCSLDTGFVLWGKMARDIGPELSCDTSAHGWAWVRTPSDEERMTDYLKDRDQRLSRGERLPPAWVVCDF